MTTTRGLFRFVAYAVLGVVVLGASTPSWGQDSPSQKRARRLAAYRAHNNQFAQEVMAAQMQQQVMNPQLSERILMQKLVTAASAAKYNQSLAANAEIRASGGPMSSFTLKEIRTPNDALKHGLNLRTPYSMNIYTKERIPTAMIPKGQGRNYSAVDAR